MIDDRIHPFAGSYTLGTGQDSECDTWLATLSAEQADLNWPLPEATSPVAFPSDGNGYGASSEGHELPKNSSLLEAGNEAIDPIFPTVQHIPSREGEQRAAGDESGELKSIKTKRAKRAYKQCSIAKSRCDQGRPCGRCTRLGRADQCVDRDESISKKRKPTFLDNRGTSDQTICSCVPCSSMKVKCDNNRPCRRCVRMNRADLCVDRPSKRNSRNGSKVRRVSSAR